jgi:hypothetical protein
MHLGHPNPKLNYNLADTRISVVDEDLGDALSSSLKPKLHIAKVKKCYQLLGIIDGHQIQSMKAIFKGIIRPHLDYASPVWTPT